KTDYNSVVNIITTIAQSQFTLFSGRPGSGKTSLAKMLGNSLGLQKRFLNIPVARGWTNSRDILGFYNSLSSSFNPAATGLYDLLTQLNNECKREHEAAPAICLLDEFNLSQPEHYFSPFLEMADPESERIIATGDHNSPYLEVPQYLRFLGTINNDDSVQSLTARMVDRAAIISFDDVEPNFDISLDSIKRLDKREHARISGNKFIELFAPNSLELAPDIEHTLKQIVDTLSEENPERGMSICVSYRKIKAMRSYYNVASPLYIDSRFVALDYAVCQHIIPLLNGYGQNFGKRLVSLLNVIPSDMVISRKMLKRIIDIGNQNMFTYGFNL
ncbi:MAG: AAA family ATPase, partial [Aeromonas sp.]